MEVGDTTESGATRFSLKIAGVLADR